ncbi:MAG: anion permease [Treponema sp.]|nr:anion permease [Treponema sp.]
MKRKHLIGISISVFILIIMFFIPATESLGQAGIRTIGMLVAFLILLITEALPMMLICLIFLSLMPLLKVTPNFSSALVGFSNQVVFFILASFGIAAAFTTIPLSKRLLIAILKVFGKSVKSMIFALMMCSAVISSLVSNVPTCAIFMAISLSFLELYSDPEAKKKTGRALMIAIPVSSMIGGMMTPAGSSINLLAIGMLEQYTGQTITFVQWMAAGIPLTIILLPIAWKLICIVYNPAEIAPKMVRDFINNLDIPEKITVEEIKTLVITGIMLVLWILSSWFRGINVMVVALAGCCAFCLPGINVLKFKTFLENVSWESFFLVGTVLSLGSAMVSNNVSDWLISLIPPMTLSTPVLTGFIVFVTFALLVFIPVAPSLVTFMSLPFITLAAGMGVSPVLIMLVFGLCVANCYLLPLDTVPLLTYSTGYYSMTDMMKSTLPLQICIVVVMSLWMPLIGRILGL